MNTKLVLWAADKEGIRHLLALQLLPEENAVRMLTFPKQASNESLHKALQDDWRRDKAVDLPEGYQQVTYPLSVTGGLLPDHLAAEREEDVQRAQHEWHFIVLSYKFYQNFERERQEIDERLQALEDFDGDQWNALKAFWSRVQDQVRDKNLMQAHARELRKRTDAMFAHMKYLRGQRDKGKATESATAFQQLMDQLATLEAQIAEGKQLKSVFNALKDLQRQFKQAPLARKHQHQGRRRIDAAFKAVKEKRFGSAAGHTEAALHRLERRLQGLHGAIEKMERSIGRDQKSLDYEARKIARTDGQLEAQIRQAKIKMIEERRNSKSAKLDDMHQLRTELEQKKTKLVQKVAKEKAKQEARAQREAARKDAKAAKARRRSHRRYLSQRAKNMAALAAFLHGNGPTPAVDGPDQTPAIEASARRLSTLLGVVEQLYGKG